MATPTLKKALTIHDVAARAEVSIATVSLALSGHPRISESTRQHVRRVAEQIGYQANPRRRRCGRRRAVKKDATLTFAFGFFSRDLKKYRDRPLFAEMLDHVQTVVREAGHHLMMANIDLPPDQAALISKRVDGFLLMNTPSLESESGKWLAENHCVSLMYSGANRKWCDWVGYDNSMIGPMAARHLLETGHRRAAVLYPWSGFIPNMRIRGFVETFQAGGGMAAVLTRPEYNEAASMRLIPELVEDFLTVWPRPTALFAISDNIAARVHALLVERGRPPGPDLTIVSCNREAAYLAGMRPTPVEFDLRLPEIARRGLKRLLHRIHYPESIHERHVELIPPRLVVPVESP